MNKNSVIIALVSLLVGIAIGWGASQVLVNSAQQAVSQASSAASSAVGTSVDVQQGAASSEVGSLSSSPSASASDAAEQEAASSQSDESSERGSSSATDRFDAEVGGTDTSDADGGSGSSSSGRDAGVSSLDTRGASASSGQSPPSGGVTVVEDGTYTSKEEVAAYIHQFGHLPSNYISKSKAKKAGWVSKEGNLDEVLPGMSIGGSEFYNDEGLLPDAPGRTWTECDINYEGGYRGAERIVFSNDGLIFYTDDHYETFEQLY